MTSTIRAGSMRLVAARAPFASAPSGAKPGTQVVLPAACLDDGALRGVEPVPAGIGFRRGVGPTARGAAARVCVAAVRLRSARRMER